MAGCFAFIILRMSCYCKCSVTLPHGAVGWSLVCDCGIPDHTHLLFGKESNGVTRKYCNVISEEQLKNDRILFQMCEGIRDL